MRRREREITDLKAISEIIEKSEILRIGFYDQGDIYIVPVNFGYEKKHDSFIFYFHGAKAGKKYELAQDRPHVGFELESYYKLSIDEEDPCFSTAYFASVIGNGRLSLITEKEQVKEALTKIMKHYSIRDQFNFNSQMLSQTAMFKLEVKELSCKAHL